MTNSSSSPLILHILQTLLQASLHYRTIPCASTTFDLSLQTVTLISDSAILAVNRLLKVFKFISHLVFNTVLSVIELLRSKHRPISSIFLSHLNCCLRALISSKCGPISAVLISQFFLHMHRIIFILFALSCKLLLQNFPSLLFLEDFGA